MQSLLMVPGKKKRIITKAAETVRDKGISIHLPSIVQELEINDKGKTQKNNISIGAEL